MTYEVRPAQDGLWTVVNDHDEIVFTGDWEQCEDWLDRQENSLSALPAVRQRARLAETLRRIIGWVAECVAWIGRQHTVAI